MLDHEPRYYIIRMREKNEHGNFAPVNRIVRSTPANIEALAKGTVDNRRSYYNETELVSVDPHPAGR